MKTLFSNADLDEILRRLDGLKPGANRQWWKMDVAQMLAHCSAAMEVAAGQAFPPRLFIGRILGPLFKKSFVGEKEFGKNSPTDPSYVVTDQRNFDREKSRLVAVVRQFGEGGEAKCTTHPHPFFGNLTPREWSIAMYKHLDHHLRQYGA